MRPALIVFVWVGLVASAPSAVVLIDANDIGGIMVVFALGYVLAAHFWFALYGVLAETRRKIEDLANRLGDG